MAENPTLTTIASFQNDSTAVATYNANLANLSTVFQDVVSRSGVSPNQMTSSFDMNNNRILNLPAPAQGTEPLRVQDLQSYAVTTANQITVPNTTVIGSIVTWNATNGLTLGTATSTGTGNNVLANSPTLVTPVIASIVNTGTLTLPNQTGTLLSTAGSVFTGTGGNPTGTSSTLLVMMGMGSTLKFTPKFSTRALITMNGSIGCTGGAGPFAQLMYGTGTAPVNGAAQTGSNVSATSAPGTNAQFPYSMTAVVTGLTLNTQIWVDVALTTQSGGFTATMFNNVCTVVEI